MSTMNDLAKRIRRSNKAYFAAGMEAGKQKVVDLFFVAAHELGKKESDDAIHRLDSSLKKLCGPFFQPFFERNDTIKDWWDK